jgi:3-oxoacyl-[acyl-carrier-protein] synthase II
VTRNGPAPAGPAADGIAVVGLACRVAGTDDADGFAQLMLDGRQQFTDIPAARMPGYDPEQTGLKTIRAAVLERTDLFDAAFFGISPRMAAWMDPQQYLLLETSWRALEDAAIPPSGLAGTETGVYISTTCTDFRDRSVGDKVMDRYSILGASSAFLANRISYQYDLCGPSMTLDTACAGGLTTVALATSALRNREIDLALAGSVNLLSYGYMHAVMVSMGAVSRTGAPRCFDAQADGYVRGEGVFVFVLKRLADALADQDPVHAVIRGAAVSHDGRAGGLTKTDSRSQQRLISRALRQAGVTVADLGYVEAHAAGSPVGDAIEVTTLGQLLAEQPGDPPSAGGPTGILWVGSAKSNIGHLEGAAGAASLLRAVMVLRRGAIPPTPGFGTLHPDADLRGMPVAIADRMVPWPRTAGSRRLVGVDSFGVGGSNAHVVLEEAAEPAAGPAAGSDALVPLSTAAPEALVQLAGALADRIGGGDPGSFQATVHTLQQGRTHLRHRRIVRADSSAALADGLRALASGLPHPRVIGPGQHTGQLDPAPRGWLDGAQDRWPDQVAVPRLGRVPLSPYPFQRRSHWVGPDRPPPVAPPYLIGPSRPGSTGR